MTEHERATTYEAIGCAIAVLERVKYRNVPDDIHHAVRRARVELDVAQSKLHCLANYSPDRPIVIGG